MKKLLGLLSPVLLSLAFAQDDAVDHPKPVDQVVENAGVFLYDCGRELALNEVCGITQLNFAEFKEVVAQLDVVERGEWKYIKENSSYALNASLKPTEESLSGIGGAFFK